MTMNKRILKNSPHQEGFSLLDLVIVVALIAIIGAISIPGFQHYAKNAKLRAAVSDIEAEIKKSKQIAVTKIQDINSQNPYEYRLNFSTSGNSYSLVRLEKDKDDTSTTVDTATLWTKYADMTKDGATNDVTITNASFAGQSYLVFYTRGTTSAADGDSIKLTNTDGRTAKITIHHITGRTYVQIPSPD